MSGVIHGVEMHIFVIVPEFDGVPLTYGVVMYN